MEVITVYFDRGDKMCVVVNLLLGDIVLYEGNYYDCVAFCDRFYRNNSIPNGALEIRRVFHNELSIDSIVEQMIEDEEKYCDLWDLDELPF